MVKIGSNRLVIIGKKFVYKFPIGKKGIIANYIEYKNYLEHKDIVATTFYKWFGLKQEKLKNIKIFPLETQLEDLPDEIKPLHKFRTYSRIQVGQSENGEWKYFDYEDSKWIFYTQEHKDKVLSKIGKKN